MRNGGSKNKGNRAEIKWYRDLKALNIPVVRSLGSGSSYDEKADLYTPNYIIECKHYKKLTPGQITSFWTKVCQESNIMKKFPVLLYKENFRNPRVLMFAPQPLIEGVPDSHYKITMDYKDFLHFMNHSEIKKRVE